MASPQHQRFLLERGSSLVLVDWLTSGRMSRGEGWTFSRLESRNEVMVQVGKGELLDGGFWVFFFCGALGLLYFACTQLGQCNMIWSIDSNIGTAVIFQLNINVGDRSACTAWGERLVECVGETNRTCNKMMLARLINTLESSNVG